MVLSNAERQARYKQRLREAAANGVTPEMVLKATWLQYEACAAGERDAQEWSEFLAQCRRTRFRDQWLQFVPDNLEDDYAEFGDDAALMRAVARVAHAVKFPPKS